MQHCRERSLNKCSRRGQWLCSDPSTDRPNRQQHIHTLCRLRLSDSSEWRWPCQCNEVCERDGQWLCVWQRCSEGWQQSNGGGRREGGREGEAEGGLLYTTWTDKRRDATLLEDKSLIGYNSEDSADVLPTLWATLCHATLCSQKYIITLCNIKHSVFRHLCHCDRVKHIHLLKDLPSAGLTPLNESHNSKYIVINMGLFIYSGKWITY